MDNSSVGSLKISQYLISDDPELIVIMHGRKSLGKSENGLVREDDLVQKMDDAVRKKIIDAEKFKN